MIGHGGRTPAFLIQRLTSVGVRTVADVRLRPDRASMRVNGKAKTPDKGIDCRFASAGSGYRSMPRLGNEFLKHEDWPERCAAIIQCAGHLLVARLERLETPVCLRCAECRVAEFLASQGAEVLHLEEV